MKLSTKKILISIFALAAIMLLAYCISSYMHRMPGRFLYGNIQFIVEQDWQRKHDLRYEVGMVYNKGFAYRGPRLCLTMAPDRQSAAYLMQDDDVVNAIVVLGLNELPRRERPPYGSEPKWNDRAIKLEKYHIPFCLQSNLEWSPDGKKLAYASAHKLYVINLADGKVAAAALPPDPNIDAMEQEWSRYYQWPILISDILKPADIEGANKEASKIEKKLGASLGNQLRDAVLSAKAMQADDTSPISSQAAKVAKQSSARIRQFFHLQSPEYFLSPDIWLEMYRSRPGSAGKSLRKSYIYSGHKIRWCSNDTILSDNWQLTISPSAAGSMTLNAVKIPVVSEFNIRPTWNRKGDIAAYLLPRWNKKIQIMDEKGMPYRPRELILVNRSGKVLFKRLVSSWDDEIQWSKDDRYLALHNYRFDVRRSRESHRFSVYDTQSTKAWNMIAGDVDGLSGKKSGWIFDL